MSYPFGWGSNDFAPQIGAVDGIARDVGSSLHPVKAKFVCPSSRQAAAFRAQTQLKVQPVHSTGLSERFVDASLLQQAKLSKFTGKTGETMLLHFEYLTPTLYLGLGEADKFSISVWREALTSAFEALSKLDAARLYIWLPDGIKEDELTSFASEVSLTAHMSLYRFSLKSDVDVPAKAKEEAKAKAEEQTVVVVAHPSLKDAKASARIRKGLAAGEALGRSVTLIRDLINAPANIATPEFLAYHAELIDRGTAGKHHVETQVFDEKWMEKENMRAALAVFRASTQPSKFIKMHYKPANAKPGIKLAIVGKGLCYDSGGLDIKVGGGMRTMQCDKSGACTMIGFMQAIALLKLPIEVVGYAACGENMIAGNAYKAGDIVKTRSGRTIEIGNTDAEGRVVLADVLDYAQEQGASHIVELSTLTGAIVAAIGDDGAGLFTENDELAERLTAASKAADEQLWRMPLWKRHDEQISSPLADAVNIGSGGKAGASTAAKFLIKFAGKQPFAHLDIAGTAYRSSKSGRYPANATGWGLLLLAAFASGFLKKK